MPSASPSAAGPIRTVSSGLTPGIEANGTPSAAVVVPAARSASSSPADADPGSPASSTDSSATVATTALPR